MVNDYGQFESRDGGQRATGCHNHNETRTTLPHGNALRDAGTNLSTWRLRPAAHTFFLLLRESRAAVNQ